MCFDIPRIKFVNIAKKWNKVFFLSGREGSTSYGCLYE